jgi:Ni/Co efflux regulator RcnB
MKRTSALLLAALIAAAPMAAGAQERERERPQPPERREQQTLERPRVSMAQAVQRASAGRSGRFVGARSRGDDVVVRWEYPGGRLADIVVDGRTGRVIGER